MQSRHLRCRTQKNVYLRPRLSEECLGARIGTGVLAGLPTFSAVSVANNHPFYFHVLCNGGECRDTARCPINKKDLCASKGQEI